jgi:hypothetical protein
MNRKHDVTYKKEKAAKAGADGRFRRGMLSANFVLWK